MAEQTASPTSQSISKDLNAKLEKRPSWKEAGHGVSDINLASTLQSTIKKLETEQKKDIVTFCQRYTQKQKRSIFNIQIDKNLKRRGSASDHGIDTNMASSIQPIAKALNNKMRRDSLKQTLQSRPEMSELIDSGVLKPYCLKLANSLQVDANHLEQALANQVSKEYLKKIGILEPYKKNVDAQSLDIEKASALLLRALVYRKASNEQANGKEFGYLNIASSLQSTAKALDTKQKKDKISSALQKRQSVEEVMEKQCQSLGYDINAAPSLQASIKNLGKEMIKDKIRNIIKEKERRRSSISDTLAPSLQAIANKLAMEQRKDSLKEQLESRPDALELIDLGILKPFAVSLASRLQMNAVLLEQQLAIRVSENYLKQIGVLEPYKKNVDCSSISGNLDIESTANLILSSLLQRKASLKIDNNGIAPALASKARELKMAKSKNVLKQKLNAQMEKSEIVNKAIFDDSVSPRLSLSKKKLEIAQKSDIVSHTLKHRMTADMHGIDVKISPAIQSIAKSLHAQRRRDSLKSQMNARPDREELIDSGILKPFCLKLADSLQMDASHLEQALANQVSKEYLKEIGVLEPYKKNVDAQSLDIEKAAGLLLRSLFSKKEIVKKDGAQFGYSKVADSLQSTAKALDMKQKKDKISNVLQKRQSVDEVMEKQCQLLGYEKNVSPSLLQTIKDLGREMIRDELKKALRDRVSLEEAALYGVDTKNSSLIQGAMNDLKMAQKRDSISKTMKRRPSADEIGIDTNLARGLQGIAKTLEMEMKTDVVSHKLSDLGIVRKVKTEGLIAALDKVIGFVQDYDL